MKKALKFVVSTLLAGVMLASCDSATTAEGNYVIPYETISDYDVADSSPKEQEVSTGESISNSKAEEGENAQSVVEESTEQSVAASESVEKEKTSSEQGSGKTSAESSDALEASAEEAKSTATPAPAKTAKNTKEPEDPDDPLPNIDKPKPVRTGTYYKSELTGEMIDVSLQNLRPVAIMVDNEISTYPHYGINQADIVYEMMNSTANGRISRFMCLVKDYEMITRFGGVRSIRPTNFLVGFPYEAIFCHDGGPYYINDYLAKRYCYHFSGIFARFTRPSSEHPAWATSQKGKSYASEFTEFVTYENYKNPNTGKSYTGLKTALSKASFSTNYSSNYKGTGFHFLDSETDLPGSSSATEVSLPYPHTSTGLKYNSSTKTYDLYEYGNLHTDAADGGAATTFKNVLLLKTSFAELDDHGYMIYNYYNFVSSVADMADGYYLTNGHVIPIKWNKSADDSEPAHYYNAETGSELQMNVGKIYINLVPADSWYSVVIK